MKSKPKRHYFISLAWRWKMSKHVLGPWEALIVSDYKPNSVLETYIKKIAIVGPVKENGGQSHIADVSLQFGENQSSANANLIAAAPDLLEALKSMYRIYSILAAATPTKDDSFMIEARKAIQKAEGRES